MALMAPGRDALSPSVGGEDGRQKETVFNRSQLTGVVVPLHLCPLSLSSLPPHRGQRWPRKDA